MENPPHIIYAPEELFTLKTGSFMFDKNGPFPTSDRSFQSETVVTPPVAVKSDFWNKYQWYIAGVVAVAGICFYIYKRQQNKRKQESNPSTIEY